MPDAHSELKEEQPKERVVSPETARTLFTLGFGDRGKQPLLLAAGILHQLRHAVNQHLQTGPAGRPRGAGEPERARQGAMESRGLSPHGGPDGGLLTGLVA